MSTNERTRIVSLEKRQGVHGAYLWMFEMLPCNKGNKYALLDVRYRTRKKISVYCDCVLEALCMCLCSLSSRKGPSLGLLAYVLCMSLWTALETIMQSRLPRDDYHPPKCHLLSTYCVLGAILDDFYRPDLILTTNRRLLYACKLVWHLLAIPQSRRVSKWQIQI